MAREAASFQDADQFCCCYFAVGICPTLAVNKVSQIGPRVGRQSGHVISKLMGETSVLQQAMDPIENHGLWEFEVIDQCLVAPDPFARHVKAHQRLDSLEPRGAIGALSILQFADLLGQGLRCVQPESRLDPTGDFDVSS